MPTSTNYLTIVFFCPSLFQGENNTLEVEVEILRHDNAALKAEVERLQRENAELRAKLGAATL